MNEQSKLQQELPPELVKQLSKGRNNDVTQTVLSLFDVEGKHMGIDDILIGFWYAKGVVKKRVDVISAVYRLQQKGLLFKYNTGRPALYARGKK